MVLELIYYSVEYQHTLSNTVHTIQIWIIYSQAMATTPCSITQLSLIYKNVLSTLKGRHQVFLIVDVNFSSGLLTISSIYPVNIKLKCPISIFMLKKMFMLEKKKRAYKVLHILFLTQFSILITHCAFLLTIYFSHTGLRWLYCILQACSHLGIACVLPDVPNGCNHFLLLLLINSCLSFWS